MDDNIGNRWHYNDAWQSDKHIQRDSRKQLHLTMDDKQLTVFIYIG